MNIDPYVSDIPEEPSSGGSKVPPAEATPERFLYEMILAMEARRGYKMSRAERRALQLAVRRAEKKAAKQRARERKGAPNDEHV